MVDVTRAIATATRLIQKHGVACKWQVNPDGAAPPATPWKADTSGAGPTEQDVFIVFLGGASSGLKSLLRAAGVDVPESQGDALMPGGLSFTPTAKDRVKLGNDVYLIPKSVVPLAPSGVPILYSINWAA